MKISAVSREWSYCDAFVLTKWCRPFRNSCMVKKNERKKKNLFSKSRGVFVTRFFQKRERKKERLERLIRTKKENKKKRNRSKYLFMSRKKKRVNKTRYDPYTVVLFK